MPRPTSLPTSARLARRMRERAERGRDEGGFILLETMVALTLITVIMAAVGMEYVSGMAVSAHQRSMTTASQIATSAVAEVRGLNATDLLTGRTKTAVIAQRNRMAGIQKVSSWVSADANHLAYDNAGGQETVSTARRTETSSGKAFGVEKYLECNQGAAVVGSGTATEKSVCGTTDVKAAMRVVVAVVWSDRGCPAIGTPAVPTCAFVTSTLVDTHADPTFDLNQSLPPAPVVAAVPDQNRSVGETVSLQLLVQQGKGASPFSWALTSGTLPAGLSLSPAGVISGTLTANATATTTFTVTDAFLRTAQVTFSWSVTPPLVVAKPADQASVTGTAITAFDVKASGGATPYTFTDPGSTLPAGVTISSGGTISGKPTRAAVYPVSLTVTDKGGRTATTSFTWSVDEPVVITSPGDQVATADQAETFTLTTSGGTAGYTYSATSLPSWLTLRPNADTTSVTVSGRAPSTTSTTVGVTITATDSKNRTASSTTFQIKVVAKPTIITPAPQQTTANGSAGNVQVSATCLNTPCTYSLAGAPAGLSINDKGVISGTVTSSPQAFTQVKVTVTDAAGVQATTGAFTWTVNRAPSATAPPTRTTAFATNPDAPFAGFFSGGTGPYTYSATGLPSGLTIDASTGVVGGRTASVYSKSSPRITVTDASGVTVSTTFTWYVSSLSLVMPDTNVPAQSGNGSRNLSDTRYTSGGTAPYTWTATNLPANWTLSGSVVSGPINQKFNTVVVVTVTDATGASVTANWNLKVS